MKSLLEKIPPEIKFPPGGGDPRGGGGRRKRLVGPPWPFRPGAAKERLPGSIHLLPSLTNRASWPLPSDRIPVGDAESPTGRRRKSNSANPGNEAIPNGRRTRDPEVPTTHPAPAVVPTAVRCLCSSQPLHSVQRGHTPIALSAASHGVPAIKALVAGATSNGDRPTHVARRRVGLHLLQHRGHRGLR